MTARAALDSQTVRGPDFESGRDRDITDIRPFG